MTVKDGWQYDEAYDKNIADWEDFLRSSRLSSKRMTWYINLFFPFLLMGVGFSGRSWIGWIGIFGLYVTFVKIFSFFEELNENIRYIRHQVVRDLEHKDEQ